MMGYGTVTRKCFRYVKIIILNRDPLGNLEFASNQQNYLAFRYARAKRKFI